MSLSCGEGGSTGAEVLGQINANTEAIGDTTPLGDDTMVEAIGTNTDKIGDLTTLTTDEKGSLVGAINELDAKDFRQLFYGAKATGIAVPDTYNTLADVELVTPVLPAGRYLLSYAIQVDMNAQKDKVLAYKTVGDFPSDEFGVMIPTANTGGTKISENYSFYKDLPDGALTYGMNFRDISGGNGFTVDFVDIMVMWVGFTPAP